MKEYMRKRTCSTVNREKTEQIVSASKLRFYAKNWAFWEADFGFIEG
jgi:hypothetical protein